MPRILTAPTVGWIEESDDRMLKWRYEEFCEMGFLPEWAEALAAAECSPGQARELIKRGCPIELALDIMI